MVQRYRLVFAAVLAAGLVLPSAGHAAIVKTDSRTLAQRTASLKARDAAAEARAAMDKGDFRLIGELYVSGKVPHGVWTRLTPGVQCAHEPAGLTGKHFVHRASSDPQVLAHGAAGVAFLSRYNTAIVGDVRFPYPELCALDGRARVSVYTGPVTTVTQAVRSRDVAKLAALAPTAEMLNAAGDLGLTPLDWATVNRDLDMAAALIDAGANAGRGDEIDQTPLGLAILGERYDLAREWASRGAGLPRETGLCPVKAGWGAGSEKIAPRYWNNPDGTGAIDDCSWAGLVIGRGQWDLLEDLLKAHSLGEFDDQNALALAFQRAAVQGDTAVAHRLLPHLANGNFGYGPATITWLYRRGLFDLLSEPVISGHIAGAHSGIETLAWQQALEGRRYKVFALLYDHGRTLNRLSKAQWADCQQAIAQSDERTVFNACIRASATRSRIMVDAIKAGDARTFAGYVSDMAEVEETYTFGLDAYVAAFGTPDMVDALVRAGLKGGYGGVYEGQATDLYDGAARANFAADVKENQPDRSGAPAGRTVVAIAYNRGDRAMLQKVLDSGYTGLADALDKDVGGIMRIFTEPLDGFGHDQVNSEVYPNRPDPAVMARLERDIPLAAHYDGPQALDSLFTYASARGWNDVVSLILKTGLDVRGDGVMDPNGFWSIFGSSNAACKPSTVRLLIAAGVPLRYPVRPNRRKMIPGGLASECRDGATIGVIIREGGIDVNEPADDIGQTALDYAVEEHMNATIRTLKALGGKPGKEIHADMLAKWLDDHGYDPDLW